MDAVLLDSRNVPEVPDHTERTTGEHSSDGPGWSSKCNFILPCLSRSYGHRIIGRRCRWSSRKTKNYLWLPNTFNTSPSWNHGAGRVGDGRIYSFHKRAGELRHLAEKPGMGEGGQDGTVD